jgi:hypothetical protein
MRCGACRCADALGKPVVEDTDRSVVARSGGFYNLLGAMGMDAGTVDHLA